MSESTTGPPLEALPLGCWERVAGVGPAFYRFAPGPAGSPTVVLLHGWTSTSDVTWHGVFAPLSSHFTVVAPDLRGHGRGPRGPDDARLGDVAADVVSLMEALHLPSAVVVGYSLGGAVAQLVARSRPDLVRGLVLCASACRVCEPPAARLGSALLKVGSKLIGAVPEAPVRLLAIAVMRAMFGNSDFERWSRARTSGHQWSDVLSIGADLMSFDSREWIEDLEVPAAAVITAADRFVSPVDQRRLAQSIGAHEVSVNGDHSACLAQPADFADALIRACHSVTPGRERRVPASDAASGASA